ncbi:MAG: TonB-dependent receptor [Melioribacter sp.]|uniref:TonB-dependent receptor n=1 Tax=Rosettibacter primus TaxID=3111523 RepID=UPI00247CD81F|nr:TonB-dependent receptor [Melioribacter sp.]
MKNLIILFLFLLNNIYAQTIINGRVFSSSSKQPLYLANVIVKGTHIGTSTDENGKFILKGEFKSSDKLLISYLGYEPKEISIEELLKLTDKNIFLESKLITSQTVLVKGTIAKSGITPISFTKLERSKIADTYTYQDIPEILSYTPSATFYSENGNGLGYNYLSIRGFDQRRISVSINGIPQNDPEDHNVYWIDFPDLLESTELIQVQRGAGSGIAGYAAIGGAINIITSTYSDQPRVEFSSSIGSFNTRKYSAAVSSGLINNKYSIYAKLSQTLSSGYRNSSWVDLKSYHLSAVRYDDNLITQINIFGGPIADGLAYTGLPKFAIKDRNLRKANYSYWEADEKNYTYTLERRPDEIENFSQPHFELLNEFKLNDNVTFNSALFLVLGNGFFDYDGSWADTTYFRLTKENGFYPTENPGNVLIRAMVENKQWGWIPRASIKHNNGELILGGELRLHNSIHWGSINYGENLPKGLTKDFRYYYYEGGKDILSFFVNENYQLTSNINILAEAQLSYHKYKIKNERYVNNNFSIDDLYFNPRFGINYRYSSDWNLYFSFARVTREPRLKNYYDAAESSGGAVPQFETKPDGTYDFSKPLVKPETMNNFELGSSYSKENFMASFNLFYMLFKDEIVKRGQVDRFGQPITGNMERTIHYGFEGTFSLKHNEIIELTLNGSLSKNYISSGAAYFYDKKTASTIKLDLSGNRISGFPDITFNAILKMNYENLLVQLTGKYVGSFFTDNYDTKLADYLKIYSKAADYTDNKVDAYFVANFYASYNLFVNSYLKNIKFYVQINNIFDNLYAAYGIGKEFFPAAERNYLFGVKLSL